MIRRDPNRGWSDAIGTFVHLQLAVKRLASGKGKREVRMEEATSALTGLIPAYFPVALRKRAERVLSARERVRREHSNAVSIRFDLLKEEECAALTQDIMSLYEACIFDMSKEIRDIVHPNEESIVAAPKKMGKKPERDD
jgi:hypothetical protein